MNYQHVQSPTSGVMVRPHHFMSNPETAADNAFQFVVTDLKPEIIAARARDEYESLMKLVRLAEQKIKSSQFIKSIVIYCTEGKTPETKTADYSILVYKRTYLTTFSNQNICFNSRNELFFKS